VLQSLQKGFCRCHSSLGIGWEPKWHLCKLYSTKSNLLGEQEVVKQLRFRNSPISKLHDGDAWQEAGEAQATCITRSARKFTDNIIPVLQSPFIGKRVPLVDNGVPILYPRYTTVAELLVGDLTPYRLYRSIGHV
jgi:hypothetical protein